MPILAPAFASPWQSLLSYIIIIIIIIINSSRQLLSHTLQGDRKWIGTTEACSILRHQGVTADIVDFIGTAASSRTVMRDGSTVHIGVTCDACSVCPVVGTRYRSFSRSNYDLCGRSVAGTSFLFN